MTDKELFIRDHVFAVTRLLIGNRKLKDGIIITGGGVLSLDKKVALAGYVGASRADLIHLEFDHDDRGDYRLRSLVMMAERDGVVVVKSDCQLWMGKSGTRALLLPPAEHFGAFRLAPNEVVQVPQRPTNDAAGQLRATARLARIVASRAGADGLSVKYAFAA